MPIRTARPRQTATETPERAAVEDLARLSDSDRAVEEYWSPAAMAARAAAATESESPLLDAVEAETARDTAPATEVATVSTAEVATEVSATDLSVDDYWSVESIAARATQRAGESTQSTEVGSESEQEISVQRDFDIDLNAKDDPNARKVSGAAMARLNAAKAGINETKRVLAKGAGNQFDDLQSSKFNSYYRMQVMRDPECWILDSALYGLAGRYPEALTSAKGELAQAGNCGEHAAVAFDFLRMMMADDVVNRVSVKGLDHAFVILGNLGNDADEDMAVCDPWPTAPTSCLWDEHFAFTSNRGAISTNNSVTGDDKDIKATLAQGLRLSAKGENMVTWVLSDERTEEELENGKKGDHPWIWSHADTTSGDTEATHRTESPGS